MDYKGKKQVIFILIEWVYGIYIFFKLHFNERNTFKKII